MKDPEKGIGCTIKSAAGHIFVNRIVEDGPIAHTGVLRPGMCVCVCVWDTPSNSKVPSSYSAYIITEEHSACNNRLSITKNPKCKYATLLFFLLDDEILDVNGTTITGLTVAEVGKVIQSCPHEFLATVRPVTTLKKLRQSDNGRVNYVNILPNLGSKLPASDSTGNINLGSKVSESVNDPKDNLNAPQFVMKVTSEEPSSDDSLDDVGNYDDEDELSGVEKSPTPPPERNSPQTGDSNPTSPSLPVDTAAEGTASSLMPPSSPVALASPVQTLPGEPPTK